MNYLYNFLSYFYKIEEKEKSNNWNNPEEQSIGNNWIIQSKEY